MSDFIGWAVVMIFVCILSIIITYNSTYNVGYKNCIKYHENMTVVEAEKTCKAILGAK